MLKIRRFWYRFKRFISRLKTPAELRHREDFDELPTEFRNSLKQSMQEKATIPFQFNRRGKKMKEGQDDGKFVLISAEQYETFIAAAEELEDLRAVEESMQDPGPNIPWEQVKKDLGF